MIVMQRRSIGDAFTSDHHFEQAGFTCLLRDPTETSNGPGPVWSRLRSQTALFHDI
jgi:hypothetical protein